MKNIFSLNKFASGHKCMVCGKDVPDGWGPTMCAECVKKEEKGEKTASSYTMPNIDQEKHPKRPGLEGPFRLKSGKIVYYDPREGKYYDAGSDFYLEQDEYEAHNRDRVNPHLQTQFNSAAKKSYFDLSKVSQFSGDEVYGDDITSGPLPEMETQRPCSRCKQPKPDVEVRHSYGIYAGRFCDECAYNGYRDHCGLVKNRDGSYSQGGQGDTRELEEMGEQVEPEDGGFY